MKIFKLFNPANTRFILLKDAANEALKSGVLNNKEIDELRLSFQKCLKKKQVTDTVYINGIKRNGEALKLSGEFYADSLICENITLHSSQKVVQSGEINEQMNAFRKNHNLSFRNPKEERTHPKLRTGDFFW